MIIKRDVILIQNLILVSELKFYFYYYCRA